MRKTYDFAIIGGGIIGLAIALELRSRFPDSQSILLEKESVCGAHASGLNSGVLHAGFYYTKDSLKARFTKQGNEILTTYCLEKGLRINRCGKLVVAKDESELAGLTELLERARVNGVELSEINEKEAREIEPKVKTCSRALFSPTTAIVDPVEVVQTLARDAVSQGVEIHYRTRYLGHRDGAILTSEGMISPGYLINAAGLYADKIGKDFGVASEYSILPFKGFYLHGDLPPGFLRTLVVSVPDFNYPFLGIHILVTVEGLIKIGPTAIPAFWRENYGGLENFNLGEFCQIVTNELGLIFHANINFKRLAVKEWCKHFRLNLVAEASRLIAGIKPEHFRSCGKPGIRAQLYHVTDRKLLTDFCIEGNKSSMHILNAVSPGFTASIPFARHICDRVESHIS